LQTGESFTDGRIQETGGRMKKIAIALYILGLFYGFCMASEDQYQRAKESEQLVAEFWQADNGHYSGEQQ
jgi:hypothetical protein